MKINFQQLKKLPVFTESGQKLGHVFDLVLEIQTQSIINFSIRRHFASTTFQVSREQIVKIDHERIIVKDALIEETNETLLKTALKSPMKSTAIENSQE